MRDLALERRCAWCSSPATTRVIATDACEACSKASRHERVTSWLRMVEGRRHG